MQLPFWKKECNKFIYWIHGHIMIIWEPLQRFVFIWNNVFLCFLISAIEIINEWMQKSESELYQKERVQFKDQDFLARFSCIIEITLCEKFHRKKNFLIWYETAGSKRVWYLSLKLYQRTLQGKWGCFRPYLQPSQSGTTTNFEGVPFLAFS